MLLKCNLQSLLCASEYPEMKMLRLGCGGDRLPPLSLHMASYVHVLFALVGCCSVCTVPGFYCRWFLTTETGGAADAPAVQKIYYSNVRLGNLKRCMRRGVVTAARFEGSS